MPNVKNNASAQETRRRLLDAGGQVFAERGLHAATIKEITARAGANMAAINYHFSDKFALYAAVIRHALSLAPGVTSMKRTVGSPEERLRTLIADVIEDMYDPAQPSWLAALLAHEFAQPTAALTTVMDELIQPRVDYVNQIIRDILGPGVSEEQVGRAGMSVTAQCFFYLYNGQVIRRLHPELLRADQKQDIVDHIYEFSLGGLRAMRRQGKPVRRRV